MLIPLFVLLLREEDKSEAPRRYRSFLLLLKAALSRLPFGPAYYEDPLSRTSSFSLLGSRGSYAAAFPLSFSASTRSDSLTLVQWIRWQRSSSLKNGTAVVRRQARSDLGRSTLES